MRQLDGLSGSWRGFSLQEGFRISEIIDLRISGGSIYGQGEDSDGIFELEGGFDSSNKVFLTRRYTFCTSGDEGVGIPYDYRGVWDGEMISGHWNAQEDPSFGDQFEMWPESGESLSISDLMSEREPVGAS